MFAGPWIYFAAQDRLHSVELGFGDRRLMLAFIPFPTATRVFKPAVIKRVMKDVIKAAQTQRTSALFFCLARAESPLLVRNIQDACGGVYVPVSAICHICLTSGKRPGSL